jgi:hypothetical protein
MSTVQQKEQTVLWYAKFEFIIWVQREFRLAVWEKHNLTRRPRRSDEDVDRTKQAFILAPRNFSICV